MSRGFLTVLKMHIKQQMLSKAFVWSTLLMPVIMFGVVLIQNSLLNLDDLSDEELEQIRLSFAKLASRASDKVLGGESETEVVAITRQK